MRLWKQKIQEMLDLGVIKPSVSPCSLPIVLVPKKDGSMRFCIDFRKLNKVTEFDAEPMSNMQKMINKRSGHEYFTNIDLIKGYWQMEWSDESKLLNAFETPQGLFKFKVVVVIVSKP